MNKFKLNAFSIAIIALVLMNTSCNDDNTSVSKPDLPSSSKYILAVQADPESPSYLLSAESLDEGEVTVQGNGTEASISTRSWVFHKNNQIFGLDYRNERCNSYVLDPTNGNAKPYREYGMLRFESYGVWGDSLFTSKTNVGSQIFKTNKQGKKCYASEFQFNWINAIEGGNKDKNFPAENYLGNGEIVELVGFVEANGWGYTSVIPKGMSQYGVLEYDDKIIDKKYINKGTIRNRGQILEPGQIITTQYPDEAHIAIFKNKADFPLKPTIVSTDKMGFACGKYRGYYQTIWAADNGDLYVFSPGYGRSYTGAIQIMENGNKIPLEQVQGEYKAKVMRIKAGETTFDDSYDVVDLESLLGNRSFLRTYHLTEDYFLIQAFNETNSDGGVPKLDAKKYKANRLFIYYGKEKSVKEITGLPNLDSISEIGETVYSEKKLSYIPITTNGEGAKPILYAIDPVKGIATAGLNVDALSVLAIGKLTSK